MFRKNIMINLVLLLALVSPVSSMAATVWEVPADKANIANPIPTGEKSLMHGEGAYRQLCMTCHGEDGHGNKFSLSYWFSGTPDITKSIQGQSDGALYYKIYTGREAMPSFSSTLMPEDIWNIINYLKTLK